METIHSPAFGYSVTFLEEGLVTGEDFDLVRIVMQAGGGNFRHYHLGFTELFSVEAGTLGVELRGKQTLLELGQQMLIPKRAPHRFFNPTTSEVTFTARMEPASRFPDVLRIAYGLARDGRTNRKGLPKNILHTAYLWHLDKTAAAVAPPWLVRLIMAPLVIVVRLIGVGRGLQRYVTQASA